jgi:peptidoglycan/xylan/chitin deacetylase (PgdA/CDA1 family)
LTVTAKIASKIKRIAREQIAGSSFGGVTAKGINGNYILMYHGVTQTGSTQFNTRHASIKCFRKQIAFLKKYCSVISLQDFMDGKFHPQKANFAITFDDGYLNNFTNALPVLEQYKCPATFFITGLNQVDDNILWADYVNIASTLTSADIEVEGELFSKKGNTYFSATTGKSLYHIIKHEKAGYAYKQQVRKAFASFTHFQDRQDIKEYWQLMSDHQIVTASRSKLITIGSHGYYHNNLGTISHENAVNELGLSKKYLD